MVLSKGMKSLQLSLNELIPKLGLSTVRVSNMAFVKARRKFKHTAFIELNQTAVVDVMYGDDGYHTWHGRRILGVDASKLQLPTNPDTKAAFGSLCWRNHPDPGRTAVHSYAVASVVYDVLNRVAIDACLGPARAYEVELAAGHLKHVRVDDLVIYDRGYCSFRMVALATRADGDFLIRCHRNSFKLADKMLAGKGPDDVTCEIIANHKFLHNTANKYLPTNLTVRFVRVTLASGEHEVLVTSLLDRKQYPTDVFKELYRLRWGIETFYGVLKTRLNLENFSGFSAEAVRQDFYATVLLTGIESIFTEDAETKLRKQTAGHRKQVNKAVSFNAIKYRALELFVSNKAEDVLLAELTELFMTNPTLARKDRKPPRLRPHDCQLLHFWRRRRKAVF